MMGLKSMQEASSIQTLRLRSGQAWTNSQPMPSDAIDSPVNDASARRPSTRANPNRSTTHPVGIGVLPLVPRNVAAQPLFAEPEYRCTPCLEISALSAARLGRMDLGPTHAGRGDRYVDPFQRRGELGLEGRKLPRLATPLQAFDQTVQGPDVVGMLGAALDPAAQAEIVAIDGFGLVMMALLHQQRGQGMARWMHPGPRFGVVQIVVA